MRLLPTLGLLITLGVSPFLAGECLALSASSDAAMKHYQRGLDHRKSKNPRAAEQEFRNAIALQEAFAEVHNALGATLLDIGQTHEAIGEFKKAIELKETLTEAHYNLAWAYYRTGMPQEGLLHIRMVIRLNAEDYDARKLFGVLLIESGNPKEALTHLQLVADKAPSAEVFFNLGSAFSIIGQREEAIGQYRKAIAQDQTFAPAHYNLGLELYYMGDREAAIASLRMAVSLDPKDVVARNSLAIMLLDSEKKDYKQEAVAQFEELTRLQPKSAEAYYNVATALEQVGSSVGLKRPHEGEVISLYSQAAKLDPDLLEAHLKLGQALKTRGKFDEASKAFQTAFRLKSDLAETQFEWGLVRKAQGKDEKALEYFENAKSLDPNFTKLRFELGDAYEQRNDTVKANENYTFARQIRYEQRVFTGDPIALSTDDKPALIGERRIEVAKGPYWNAWLHTFDPKAHEVKARFTHLTYLEPGTSYLLTLDLSAIRYFKTKDKLSQKVADKLDNFLSEAGEDGIRLDPVILTDPHYFRTPSAVGSEYRISVKTIREFRELINQGTLQLPTDPMHDLLLKSEKYPPYVFGRQTWQVITSDKKGMTAIAISFWRNGKPYDEISIPVCIGDSDKDCDFDKTFELTFQSSNFFNLPLTQSTNRESPPDASIHILGLSDAVVGVLQTNTADPNKPLDERFMIWRISEDRNRFVEELQRHQDAFGKASKDPVGVGKALALTLFPEWADEHENSLVIRAKSKLQEIVSKLSRGQDPFRSQPGRLFIRMLVKDFSMPMLYPLGLLYLGEGQEDTGFLGYYFMIEMPLPQQRYMKQNTCIGEWIPVLPSPHEGESVLKQAYEMIQGRFNKLPGDNPYTYQVVDGVTFNAYTDLKHFREQWVEDKAIKGPAVVTILSHHAIDRIWFQEGSPLFARNIQASKGFNSPSIAILSGCSTGAVGASRFIQEFNSKGVDAVVATNTGVSGHLAGHFLDCLSNEMGEARKQQQSISVRDLFHRTQRCLFQKLDDKSKSRYGPAVLSFTLAGNPSLTMCTGARQ